MCRADEAHTVAGSYGTRETAESSLSTFPKIDKCTNYSCIETLCEANAAYQRSANGHRTTEQEQTVPSYQSVAPVAPTPTHILPTSPTSAGLPSPATPP